MEIALLILRVGAGLLFVGHGAEKLFGWFGGYGIRGTGAFFESVGLRPGRHHATAAGFNEFVGGQQEGDPAKLAQALLTLSGSETPPLRFVAGKDALAVVEQELNKRRAQLDAWRDLSASLAAAPG
jgi:putative oxidoreductase